MDKLFEILPSMFLIIVSMILMLRASQLKYSLKTTVLIIVPFLSIQVALNVFIFSATVKIERYPPGTATPDPSGKDSALCRQPGCSPLQMRCLCKYR